MKRRRVKITGIGPVTPAGIGREAFWKGILEPVSRVRPFTKLGEEYGPFVAAYIDDFDVGRYVDVSRMPKGASRQTQFAVAGAALALRDAGVTAEELAGSNCVVVTGSSIMDFGAITKGMDLFAEKGVRGVLPRLVCSVGIGYVPEAINEVFGLSARTATMSSQCCAGLDAIGYAAALIENGEAEMAICGGTEAPLHRSPLLEFRAAGLTPSTNEIPGKLIRPFDLWRTTGAIAEGASILVLEAEDSPRPGYSFVAGYSSANDEGGEVCSGLTKAGKMAVSDAGLRLSEIDVLSAWGPGHKLIDKGEVRAMEALFGKNLEAVLAVSIKAAIGSPLGAAPSIQVATAALSQRYGHVPPTVNWEDPDPECRLFLSNQPMVSSHFITLVNAHGMGGVNSSMILQRC